MMKQALQGAQVGKTRTPKKRKILTFEPCGPVHSMIQNELRSNKSRGALKLTLEAMVVAVLGPKYPKLAQRYQVLKEEGAL